MIFYYIIFKLKYFIGPYVLYGSLISWVKTVEKNIYFSYFYFWDGAKVEKHSAASAWDIYLP